MASAPDSQPVGPDEQSHNLETHVWSHCILMTLSETPNAVFEEDCFGITEVVLLLKFQL